MIEAADLGGPERRLEHRLRIGLAADLVAELVGHVEALREAVGPRAVVVRKAFRRGRTGTPPAPLATTAEREAGAEGHDARLVILEARLLDVVVERNELVFPPKVEAKQVLGMALYSAKGILSGGDRAKGVIDLIGDALRS